MLYLAYSLGAVSVRRGSEEAKEVWESGKR